jgi:hypothetical protein
LIITQVQPHNTPKKKKGKNSSLCGTKPSNFLRNPNGRLPLKNRITICPQPWFKLETVTITKKFFLQMWGPKKATGTPNLL